MSDYFNSLDPVFRGRIAMLQKLAGAEGITFDPFSGYRTIRHQGDMRRNPAAYGVGPGNPVAPAGLSAHNYGMAFDARSNNLPRLQQLARYVGIKPGVDFSKPDPNHFEMAGNAYPNAIEAWKQAGMNLDYVPPNLATGYAGSDAPAASAYASPRPIAPASAAINAAAPPPQGLAAPQGNWPPLPPPRPPDLANMPAGQSISMMVPSQGGGFNVPGATRADLNYNPGNIMAGQWAQSHGATGSAGLDQGHGVAVFSSPQAGFDAMRDLALSKYRGGATSLNDLIAGQGGWTPGNYTAAGNIAKTMGIKATDDLNLTDASQMRNFQRALATQEGAPHLLNAFQSGDLGTNINSIPEGGIGSSGLGPGSGGRGGGAAFAGAQPQPPAEWGPGATATSGPMDPEQIAYAKGMAPAAPSGPNWAGVGSGLQGMAKSLEDEQKQQDQLGEEQRKDLQPPPLTLAPPGAMLHNAPGAMGAGALNPLAMALAPQMGLSAPGTGSPYGMSLSGMNIGGPGPMGQAPYADAGLQGTAAGSPATMSSLQALMAMLNQQTPPSWYSGGGGY